LADNVILPPGGGGDTIAADDVGGAKYQRIKLTTGADGVAGGDVTNANPMPMRQMYGATGTRTSTQITADASILAANTARVRAMFYNEGDKDFLLGEGTAAVTATNFTVRLRPGDSYAVDDNTSAWHGFFVSAPTGALALQITEVT
jgi:hypothetical protein